MRHAGRFVFAALAVTWLTWACGSSSSNGDGANTGLGGEAGEGSGLGGDVGSGATSSNGGSNTNGGNSANGGSAIGGDNSAAGNGAATGGANGLGGDTGVVGGDGSVLGNAGVAGTDPGLPTCTPVGVTCVQSPECCSGVCDPKTQKCASVVGVCTADGGSCKSGPECCTFQCGVDGKCAKQACVSDNGTCTGDAQCCGGKCTNGTCAPLNPGCSTAGNACATGTDCCSGQCGANKTCTLGGSYCIQPGDVCARDNDCCTGSCTIATGKKLGTCDGPPPGPSFCGGVDGITCGSCGDCCSRLCAPFGPTGVKICQPANGCHVTGDLCRRNEDCCGGTDDKTLPGFDHVTCEIADGADVGICRNPMACNPQGNVCHYKAYMCDISSARADCCGGLGAKSGVCQLDPLGIPRCNGLGDTCRDPGDTCASTDDCCNNTPCVPDVDGVLRCGSGVCQKSGNSCTINADCCPGSICLRAPGSTVGTCGGDPGGGGTGGSGGSSGTGGSGGSSGTSTGGTSGTGTGGSGGSGPSCSEYGQLCKANGDCCNAVPCTSGICRFAN
jgi:hypothetical protein